MEKFSFRFHDPWREKEERVRSEFVTFFFFFSLSLFSFDGRAVRDISKGGYLRNEILEVERRMVDVDVFDWYGYLIFCNEHEQLDLNYSGKFLRRKRC